MGTAPIPKQFQGYQQMKNSELKWQIFWYDDFSNSSNANMLIQFQNYLKMEIKTSPIKAEFLQAMKNYWKVIIISSGKLKSQIIKFIKNSGELQSKVIMYIFCGDLAKHQDAKQYKFVKGVYNEPNDLIQNLDKILKTLKKLKQKNLEQQIIQNKRLNQIQLKFINNLLKSYNKRYILVLENITLNYYQEILNSQFNSQNTNIHYSSKLYLQLKSIPKICQPYKSLIKNQFSQLPKLIKQLLFNLSANSELFHQFNHYVKIRDSNYYKQDLQIVLKLVSLNYVSTLNNTKTGFLYRKLKNQTKLSADINSIVQFSVFFTVSKKQEQRNAIVFIPNQEYIIPSLFKLKVEIDRNLVLYSPSFFIIRKIDNENNLIYVSQYPKNYFLESIFSPQINKNPIEYRLNFQRFLNLEQLLKQNINILKLQIQHFHENGSFTKTQSDKTINQFRKKIKQLRKKDVNNKYELSFIILELLIDKSQNFKIDQNILKKSSQQQRYNFQLLKITRLIKEADLQTIQYFQAIIKQIYPFQNQWHALIKFHLLRFNKIIQDKNLQVIKSIIGQNNQYIAEIYFRIAQRQLQQQKVNQCLINLRKSIGIYESIAIDNHYKIQLVEAYLIMADIFKQKNYLNESRLYLVNALNIMKKNEIRFEGKIKSLQQKINDIF